MEVSVTPSTLSRVLSENQPDAGRARTMVGLTLLAFALTDLAATASLGRGVTAALSGWLIRVTDLSPGVITGLVALVIDGPAFLIGLGQIRGSRWQALFKTSFRENIDRLPHLARSLPDPMALLPYALALALGLLVAAPILLGGGLGAAIGSAFAALATLGLALAMGMIALATLGTTRLERHSVVAAASTIAVLTFILVLTTSPLSQALSEASREAGAGIAGWTTLALAIAMAIVLFLGVETNDESLILLLNWDPHSDPLGGPYFDRKRGFATLTRRCILRIDTNGRQLLVATQKTGEEEMTLVQTSSLDKTHEILLNDTGFAILDFRAAAENMQPGQARTVAANGAVTYSDPNNLVSLDIRTLVLPSTSALPKDMRIHQDTFGFLLAHIFTTSALSQLVDAVLTVTVERLVKREIDGDMLAALRENWGQAYHALDFLDDAESIANCHVLDRRPGVMRSYRDKLAMGGALQQRIGSAVTVLERVRPRLTAICGALRTELQSAFLKEMEDLVARDHKLPAQEKAKVRDVVNLFNISATATPTPQVELEVDRMKMEARDVMTKLATDIKESKAEVIAAQAEVSDTIRLLLSKQMLTGAERRFLESWRPADPATQLAPPPAAPAPPKAITASPPAASSPPPPSSPPSGGAGFNRRRF